MKTCKELNINLCSVCAGNYARLGGPECWARWFYSSIKYSIENNLLKGNLILWLDTLYADLFNQLDAVIKEYYPEYYKHLENALLLK